MENIEIRRGWTQGNDTINMDETILGTDVSVVKCEPGLLADTAEQEVLQPIDVSQLVALLIQCDQDVLIETNDPDAPDDTINLTANQSLLWSDGCGFACPLTVDVAAFYVTHDGATAPSLKMRFACDPTPTASPSSSG